MPLQRACIPFLRNNSPESARVFIHMDISMDNNTIDIAESARRILENSKVQSVIDLVDEGVYCVDRDRRLVYWNPAAEHITGFTAEEAQGRCCDDNFLMHVDDCGSELCQQTTCPLHLTMQDGQLRRANVFLRHKDGRRVPIQVRTVPVEDKNGDIIGAIEIFREDVMVENLRRREQEQCDGTHFDNITGMPEQLLLEHTLHQRFDELRLFGWPFACFLVNVDNYRQLVATYGQLAGAVTLRTIGKTMAMACRESDVVGRWQESHILGILRGIDDPQKLREKMDSLCGLARRTMIRAERVDSPTTVSIGATVAKREDTKDTLLDRALDGLKMSQAEGHDRATVV